MSTEAEAVTGAGRALAAARAERDGHAAAGGPEAVAAAACKSGTGEERAQVAAHYQRLRKQAAGSTAA